MGPGILTCTNIDWFHEWPDDALEKVGKNKIGELDIYEDDENTVHTLSLITSEIHKSLREVNVNYFRSERRHNYTTPKSYLELLDFFKLIVSLKDSEAEKQLVRLERGLSIVAATEKVNKILEVLVVEQEKIAVESVIVNEATANAKEEKRKADIEEAEAEEALSEAKPIKIK